MTTANYWWVRKLTALFWEQQPTADSREMKALSKTAPFESHGPPTLLPSMPASYQGGCAAKSCWTSINPSAATGSAPSKSRNFIGCCSINTEPLNTQRHFLLSFLIWIKWCRKIKKISSDQCQLICKAKNDHCGNCSSWNLKCFCPQPVPCIPIGQLWKWLANLCRTNTV